MWETTHKLRTQWQWYNLFDLWNDYLNVVLLVLLGIMIYLGVKYHSDLEYSSEEEVNVVRKRWLKKLVPIVLVMFIIDFALVSIKTILAPDITMLFEVLKQLKN